MEKALEILIVITELNLILKSKSTTIAPAKIGDLVQDFINL